MTIYERSYDTLTKVFDSLRGQGHDELVVVLDRTPVVLADFIVDEWKHDKRVVYETLGGEPGWRSPVPAWNAGFGRVTGDVVYCLSSETVQAPGNVERVRALMSSTPNVVVQGRAECSCGPEGNEVNWGGTAPGNLLCDAAHPRPLGFIWAAPMAAVRQMGGYDPKFAHGLWYDDNDFFRRLWDTGLDFVFDDVVSGVHLHHERPVLETERGQHLIQFNRTLMMNKWGMVNPPVGFPRRETYRPGQTTWRHVDAD